MRQAALLKLMEDAEVPLQTSGGPPAAGRLPTIPGGGTKRPRCLRTRHVLFIFSGAFGELRRSVHARHVAEGGGGAAGGEEGGEEDCEEGGDQGGGAPLTAIEAAAEAEAAALRSVRTADFVQFGFESEFIGRIPVRVACRSLRRDELVRVLTDARGSVLRQMESDFRGYGIQLRLTDGALEEVADRAVAQQTGARGLLTVLEETLRDFKFEMPGTGLTRLVVDEETVREPQSSLARLIAAGPGPARGERPTPGVPPGRDG